MENGGHFYHLKLRKFLFVVVFFLLGNSIERKF